MEQILKYILKKTYSSLVLYVRTIRALLNLISTTHIHYPHGMADDQQRAAPALLSDHASGFVAGLFGGKIFKIYATLDNVQSAKTNHTIQ